MTFATLGSFAIVAMLFVMTPGPNGVLILKTVPVSGRAAGFANIAGFAAAFYLHATLAIFGLSAILLRSAEAFFVVKMLGAGYLFYIGLKALFEAWRGGLMPAAPAPVRRRGLGTAALEGFVTNALNPKVALFYLSVFPQFAGSGAGIAEVGYALTTIHALANVLWFSAIVLLLNRTGTLMRSQRFLRGLKGMTGTVFLWFGWRMATFRP